MNASQESRPFRREAVVFLVGAAVFLAANLATASRSPVVWQDEVMFADPAVNFARGNGFTTSAWFQPRDTFFAGNSPLYSMILAPWISLFGFNVVAVRSLNYVLILAAVAVLGRAVGRLELVTTAPGRLALAALIVCGAGVTFSYRSGRYDCLGIVLMAGLLAALTIPAPRLRWAILALLAALAPWVGLQLIAYTAILSLALLAFRGRSAVADVAAAAAGGMIGSALLYAALQANGVWPEFVKSVTILGGARRSLAARAADALRAPKTEPSSLILLAALTVLSVSTLIAPERRAGWRRSPAVAGLGFGLLVPCALAFVGKYAHYYTWMAYLPMAVCLVASVEHARPPRWVARTVIVLAVLACAVGLPARLVVTVLEWPLRDPAPVDRLVAEHVRPDDWVFSEYEAYYPAKRTAAALFLPCYIGDLSGPGRIVPPLSAAERDRVDVLITKPDKEAGRLRAFGGRWTLVGRYVADPSRRLKILARLGSGSKPYDLSVFRRRHDNRQNIR